MIPQGIPNRWRRPVCFSYTHSYCDGTDHILYHRTTKRIGPFNIQVGIGRATVVGHWSTNARILRGLRQGKLTNYQNSTRKARNKRININVCLFTDRSYFYSLRACVRSATLYDEGMPRRT